MSIEDIIRAWKAGEQDKPDQPIPENPVGYPLSDEDLKYAVGGQGDDKCPLGQKTVGTESLPWCQYTEIPQAC